MGRRQNVLVLAGVVAFAIGVALVFLVLKDDGDSGGSASGTSTVDVLVAKQEIKAGTKGEDAQAQVEVKKVNANNRSADALVTPSQLSNQLFSATFRAGEQIRSFGLSARSAVKQLTVPDGQEALAVSTPFDAGGACYIAPGDVVNVYQVFPAPVQNTAPGADPTAPPDIPYDTPRTELVLTNINVLDVNCQQAPLAGQTPTTNAQQAVARAGGTSTMTVVLAVTPDQAEKAIFGSTANNSFLYFSLLPDNAAPVADTPGRDYITQFTP